MRAVLLVALVYGLVLGLGEVTEALVHYAVEGHLAHSEADHGDLGDLGQEHGCGGTQHLCSCCVSQVFVAQPAPSTAVPSVSRETPPAEGWRLVSLHDPAPPHRPPIHA